MQGRITLDQMRVLDAVVRHGSFSAAARHLHRTQSAVSHAAASAEAGLGVAFFDRSGKKPRLSPVGRALYEEIKSILAHVESLQAHAEALIQGLEAEVSIAVDAAFPGKLMMQSLKEFKTQFPEVSVTLYSDAPDSIESYLRHRKTMLGFYPVDITDSEPGLVKTVIATLPIIPVVSSIHPLAQREGKISAREMNEELLLRLSSRGVRSPVESIKSWLFSSQSSRLEYLLNGFGWCLMPVHMVDEHLKAGRLVRLDLAEVTESKLHMYAVHLREAPPGPAGRWLIADLARRFAGYFPVL